MTADTLSAREAAELLGTSERTVRRWAASGRLPATTTSGRLSIPREALSALLAERARQEQDARPDSDRTLSGHDVRTLSGHAAPSAAQDPTIAALLATVERLADQAQHSAAAAAMWQERARILEHQLAQARRALQPPRRQWWRRLLVPFGRHPPDQL